MNSTTIITSLRRASLDVLELMLPATCPACASVVDDGRLVCDGCEARLNDLRRMPSCERCASPIPDAAGPCGRCLGKGISHLQHIVRLSTFESTTRDLVHALKYARRWPIANALAKLIDEQPRAMKLFDESDVLVPVPLHWWRRFLRGFNQAELVARAVARPRRLPVLNVVRRVRATPSQTAMSREARRRNMIGAFRLLDHKALEGKRVLLVDDVMTTGATLQAVARATSVRCRPASISALVVATANPLKSSTTAV